MSEQVIVGIINGHRIFYVGRNTVGELWTDRVYLACIFPDVDTARAVWFSLDKSNLDRVFVCCYPFIE